MRKLEFTVGIDSISPDTAQFGGIQGEHNATEIEITLTDELVLALKGASNLVYYRMDLVDGAGTHYIGEPNVFMGENSLTYKIPQAATAQGGNGEVRLIFSEMVDSETIKLVYTFGMRIYFESSFHGDEAEMKAVEDLSGLVEKASDCAERAERSAVFAKNASVIAGQYAQEVDQIITDTLDNLKESGEFDGEDGTPATHSWNGTVLTVTSASGTSSADLKGEKGEKGDKGATGSTGPRGEKGDKGDAYILTDADKREIADDIEAVLYSAEQGLSAPQKQAARENIDAAKNDSWEKLYEITTDGDVISWGFTKFADGYDLALKAVAVKIVATNPVESAPTIPHIIINAKYIEDSTEKFKITMPVYNIISTTGNLIGCTIISNENGLWETDVYEALENVSGTLCIRKKVTSQMFSTSADEYPVLNYINISQVKSPPKFAAGNTIEIWGIRA